MIKKYLTEKNTKLIVEVLAVFSVLFFGLVVFSNNNLDYSFFQNKDVHRGFQRGVDVWLGVNSYDSFNPKNMLTQEKVPGFFPLYFYFMAVMAWISNFSYVIFIDYLKIFIFLCYSGIALLIYFYLRKESIILAILAMSIFMFNRWTLFFALSLKQEPYVLLLLISSLLLLKKNKYLSFFIFGVATGLKHLTILVFPLYLLDIYLNVFKNQKFFVTLKSLEFKKYLVCFFLMSLPIIIPSISYYLDTPDKFVNSILFNITREPESMVNSEISIGLDRTLVLYNQDYTNNFLLFLPRIPLLIVLVLINILLFKQKLSIWSYSALTYLAFISLNPTLFDQYMLWFFAFIAFSIKEIFHSKKD
jgi:hypothetical protein